jgi:hypothetical protein
MDDLSRQRVRRALELGGADAADAVATFTTAEELHQYALNVNVNDGLLPIRSLAEHPACDRGTALYVFWQFTDLFDTLDASPRETAADPEWDAAGLLARIAERLRTNAFRSAEVAFDPSAALSLTRVQIHAYRQAGLDTFLAAVVGRSIEREWLP